MDIKKIATASAIAFALASTGHIVRNNINETNVESNQEKNSIDNFLKNENLFTLDLNNYANNYILNTKGENHYTEELFSTGNNFSDSNVDNSSITIGYIYIGDNQELSKLYGRKDETVVTEEIKSVTIDQETKKTDDIKSIHSLEHQKEINKKLKILTKSLFGISLLFAGLSYKEQKKGKTNIKK